MACDGSVTPSLTHLSPPPPRELTLSYMCDTQSCTFTLATTSLNEARLCKVLCPLASSCETLTSVMH